MQNLPTLSNAQLPSFLATAMKQPSAVMAAAMTGLSTGGAVRLVANQGRFRIKDGAAETVLPDLYLDTIIVGALAGVTKSFYATAYKPGDEKDNKQPDCSSLLGDVPDANSPSKQAASCANCPQNVWGSKISPTGTEIKACSDYRRIALVSADDPETIYQANIPPASIKPWGKYLKELKIRGVDVSLVKTRISLQEHTWVFAFAGFIDEEQYNAVQTLSVDDALGLMGRPNASVTAIAAPVAAPVIAAPAPAPVAPPPPPVVEAPAAETRGFGKKKGAAPAAAAPAPAPSMAPAAPISVAPAGSGLDALAAELGNLINSPASV